MNSVRTQYEKYPYPPLHWVALPRRNQGENLAYEFGASMAGDNTANHRGKRILVAGAGTLEALVVARQHPKAKEIVAIDLSDSSLALLRKRIYLGKLSSWIRGGFLSGPDMAPIRLVQGDLREVEEGRFDYIVASNILHHVQDPAGLFARLARWLNPGGLFRMMVYPKYSRFWLNQTSTWLQLNDVNAEQSNIRQRAVAAIALLPAQHPVRSSFEHNPEANSDTGIVDAYLHACENPLSPLDWSRAMHDAGLVRLGESHAQLSQSSFLDTLIPELESADAWAKLEILDLLLEVCANPVIWFQRPDAAMDLPKKISPRQQDCSGALEASRDVDTDNREASVRLDRALSVDEYIRLGMPRAVLPSKIYWQLGKQCRAAQCQLRELSGSDSISIIDVIDRLREEVGTRCGPPPEEAELPGLSITDYPTSTLLCAPEPWGPEEWNELQAKAVSPSGLFFQNRIWGAGTLARQAEYLQILIGATQPFLQSIEIR